jgi:hypothetical protein
VECVVPTEKKIGAYWIFVETSEEFIPLSRPKNKWEDNIKMDFQGVG